VLAGRSRSGPRGGPTAAGGATNGSAGNRGNGARMDAVRLGRVGTPRCTRRGYCPRVPHRGVALVLPVPRNPLAVPRFVGVASLRRRARRASASRGARPRPAKMRPVRVPERALCDGLMFLGCAVPAAEGPSARRAVAALIASARPEGRQGARPRARGRVRPPPAPGKKFCSNFFVPPRGGQPRGAVPRRNPTRPRTSRSSPPSHRRAGDAAATHS